MVGAVGAQRVALAPGARRPQDQLEVVQRAAQLLVELDPGSLIKPEERMAYTYNLFPYSQRAIFSGRKFFIDLLFGCVSTKLACHVTS